MFWLAFGTAAAVIGLALMTIGVTRLPSGGNLFGSVWFDGGIALLAIGVVLLLLALWLFLGRGRSAASKAEPVSGQATDSEATRDVEAVRGYFAERDKLIDRYLKAKTKEKK